VVVRAAAAGRPRATLSARIAPDPLRRRAARHRPLHVPGRRGIQDRALSQPGMLLPFALGSGLAIAFTRMPGLFSERVTTAEAMLFLGAAMSITAFPMLARIIHERGLTGTALGTL